MIIEQEDIAQKVLAIPRDELEAFVKRSVKSKDLSKILRRLNSAVLSKNEMNSGPACQAIKRLGFAI